MSSRDPGPDHLVGRLEPRLYRADAFVLRCYQEGDGAALAKSTVESFEHLRPWMPWASATVTADEAEWTVRKIIANYLTHEDFTLGIWMDDELVGGTGFHLRVGGPETRNAEIGMWIHAARAYQGLGSRVLAAMLEWGFTAWGWERLVWKCDIENVASARVAEKCGLTLEGHFRQDRVKSDGTRGDTVLYAILKSDWLSRH